MTHTHIPKQLYTIGLLLMFSLALTTAIAEEEGAYALAYSDILYPADVGIGVGYQLSSTMSAEISYLSIGKISIGGAVGSYRVAGLNAGVVGYLPVVGSLTLVGKIGTYNHTAKGATLAADYNNTSISKGLGMQYAVNTNLSIQVMLENLGQIKSSEKDTGWDYSLLTGGFRYSF